MASMLLCPVRDCSEIVMLRPPGNIDSIGCSGKTENKGCRGNIESIGCSGNTENKGCSGNTENKGCSRNTENKGCSGNTETTVTRLQHAYTVFKQVHPTILVLYTKFLSLSL